MNAEECNAGLGRQVAHYLATGECDPLGCAFPGRDVLERLAGYDRHLRNALLDEVLRREHGRRQTQVPLDFNPTVWTRHKVRPMITGLFPAAEWEIVLGMAERSIILLTRDATHRSIREVPCLESAWTIANIYLHSLGAPSLGDDGRQIVGLSQETQCYVSPEYFAEENPFADYVVHEVAHLFHNCKRRRLGLPHSPRTEWLPDVSFAKRETFAYACEIYGRILEQSRHPAQRAKLLAHYASRHCHSDDRVELDELIDILQEATAARNGWKRILARCSNPRHRLKREAQTRHDQSPALR